MPRPADASPQSRDAGQGRPRPLLPAHTASSTVCAGGVFLSVTALSPINKRWWWAGRCQTFLPPYPIHQCRHYSIGSFHNCNSVKRMYSGPLDRAPGCRHTDMHRVAQRSGSFGPGDRDLSISSEDALDNMNHTTKEGGHPCVESRKGGGGRSGGWGCRMGRKRALCCIDRRALLIGRDYQIHSNRNPLHSIDKGLKDGRSTGRERIPKGS
jgi:hypothetical protein